MKCLIFYEMGEKVRFISHLDFLRAFTRTVRRSGLPAAYSSGFNPHIKLSFALPKPTGVTSGCEILCLELAQRLELRHVLKCLCNAMPPGINIKKISEGDAKYFSNIFCACYKIVPQQAPSASVIEEFLARDNVVVMKKTKKGIKEADILPSIHKVELNEGYFLAYLSAGNESNLKPSLFMESLSQFTNYNPGHYKCHRQAIYDGTGNILA